MKITAEQVRLFLLPEVEERIRHYTALARGEVSGLGLVEEIDGGFLVTELYLPKQSCTLAGTDLDQGAVASIILQLDQAGQDSGALRFWFHSHSHLDVFWSQTDEACIAGLANGDYVLSLVTNKAGDILARVDIFRPARVTIDQVPVSVRSREMGLLDTCRLEIEERVTDMPPTPSMVSFRRGLGPRDLVDEIDLLEERYRAGELSIVDYWGMDEEVPHE
jgi:hypothetical protein